MFVSRIAAITALSLLPGAIAHAQAIPPVQVIYLQSYAYDPAPIVLHAGRPVTLQFINRAGSGHDFTAPKFFGSARIVSGTVDKGKVEPSPPAGRQRNADPGRRDVPVHCGRTFHTMLGMKSTIVVQ